MKKNCHNCIHGREESDCINEGYELVSYFVCDKRTDELDDLSSNLERNLGRPEFLEKAKRCCELPSSNTN